MSSLDGGQNVAHNGTYYAFAPQVPRESPNTIFLTTVYTASGLQDGPHTVTLTNADAGRFLDLDYMIVNSTIHPGSNPDSGTNTTEGDSTGAQREHGSSTGRIIGGVVAAVVVVFLLVLFAWLWRRRVKKRKQSEYELRPLVDESGDNISPYRDGTPPVAGSIGYPSAQHHSATATTWRTDAAQPSATAATETMDGHGHDAMPAPYAETVPPAPPASDRPAGQNAPSSRGNHLGRDRHDRSQTSAASEAGTVGHPLRLQPEPPAQGQPHRSATDVTSTARRPLTLVATVEQPTDQTSPERIAPGKAVDPRSHRTTQASFQLPPPNYHQATDRIPGQ